MPPSCSYMMFLMMEIILSVSKSRAIMAMESAIIRQSIETVLLFFGGESFPSSKLVRSHRREVIYSSFVCPIGSERIFSGDFRNILIASSQTQRIGLSPLSLAYVRIKCLRLEIAERVLLQRLIYFIEGMILVNMIMRAIKKTRAFVISNTVEERKYSNRV